MLHLKFDLAGGETAERKQATIEEIYAAKKKAVPAGWNDTDVIQVKVTFSLTWRKRRGISKVIVNGKLGIGVKNFGDVDLAVAGPIKVQGHTVQWAETVPTSGNYIRGDIIYNSSPQPSGYTGWTCIRSGSPGEWRQFGLIAG